MAVQLPLAPSTDALRVGDWQGGPEAISGKLRSGIATYYRLPSAPLVANQAFDIELRFEGVSADDGTVELRTGDSAKFASSQESYAWRLSKDTPSRVVLRIVAPAGDSYLHVTTSQKSRSAVRSFLLRVAP